MQKKLSSMYNSVSNFFDYNKSTFSGACDVICTIKKDGTFISTPFNVRFGKKKLFKPKNKLVKIEVNSILTNYHMNLNEKGEAYFSEIDSISSDSKHFEDKNISLKPNSKILESFNLKLGRNICKFSIDKKFKKSQSVSLYIYLYEINSKFIVSDIDGTITKSDIKGQLMHMFGKNWKHNGVIDFYRNIVKNGYHIIYLSSRSHIQYESTKELIEKISENSDKLPEGPIFLSSEKLWGAFTAELINKNPEDFKISCLNSIKELFNDDKIFIAGFGNRTNDFYCYKEIGIALDNIYVINEKSEIISTGRNQIESYLSLKNSIEQIFPNCINVKENPEKYVEKNSIG